MAEVVGSGGVQNEGYFLFTWANLGNGDTGRPVRFSHYADKTVSVRGTFGTGGEVTIEGSMDNANWFPLSDPQGNQIALNNSNGIFAILENPRFVRPNVSGGDVSTDLTVEVGARASL